MTRLQAQAFNLAKSKLNKSSKFYTDDLDSLREFYSKKSEADCRDAIARMTCAPVSEKEMQLHCQFGGLF